MTLDVESENGGAKVYYRSCGIIPQRAPFKPFADDDRIDPAQ